MMTSDYHASAQVCANGHIVGTGARRFPQPRQNFCGNDGLEMRDTCVTCGKRIKARYYVGDGDEVNVLPPKFCGDCGAAHPWMQAVDKPINLSTRTTTEHPQAAHPEVLAVDASTATRSAYPDDEQDDDDDEEEEAKAEEEGWYRRQKEQEEWDEWEQIEQDRIKQEEEEEDEERRHAAEEDDDDLTYG